MGGIYIFSIEIPFEELSPEEQRRVMKIKKRLKELEKNKELMEFIEREREKRMRELIEGFKKVVAECSKRHIDREGLRQKSSRKNLMKK